jgi:uncharacterized protein (DUF1778 family)
MSGRKSIAAPGAKEPRKVLSGAAKMRASGRRGILLSVTPEQHDLLSRAAFVELRPLSQFLLYHGVAAARASLERQGVKCPS